MNYTFHQLQVFLKIAQTKSITRAAEELHLTQPAVSIQLKNLQDQFEIPLTEVVGRQLYITDFGKEIAEAAQAILDQAYAINYKTLAYRGQLTGKLKIAVVSTGKYVMPYFLSDFLRENHGIELFLDITNKAQVLQSLSRNEVDFALVSVLPDQLNVDSIQLMENKLFLVGDRSAQAHRTKDDMSVLENLPMIFREQGSGTRFIMEQFLKNHNLHLIKKLELNTNEAVKQAILAGLGYSIMPLIGIKNEIASGDLKIIPVKGLPISSAWRLIWLRQKKHSPAATAYLKFVEANKARIIDEKFRLD